MDPVDRERLNDMLEHAKAAVALAGAASPAELDADKRTLLAVSYAVMIVGEAASRVSLEEQARLPDVQWRQIIGMRNRIVHGYRMRSTLIIAETIREHMPPLIAALDRHLGRNPA